LVLIGLLLLGPAFLAVQHDPYWTVVAWAFFCAVIYAWHVRSWLLQSFVAKVEQNPAWIAVLVGVFATITLESTAIESAIYFAVAAAN
jgi:hypothetical protein